MWMTLKENTKNHRLFVCSRTMMIDHSRRRDQQLTRKAMDKWLFAMKIVNFRKRVYLNWSRRCTRWEKTMYKVRKDDVQGEKRRCTRWEKTMYKVREDDVQGEKRRCTRCEGFAGLPQSVKSQGKTKFFQGQGKFSEFCTIWSGKFGNLPKVREKSGKSVSFWILYGFLLNLLKV